METLPLHPPPGPDWPALSPAAPDASMVWWVAVPVGAVLLLLAGLILVIRLRTANPDPVRLLMKELSCLQALQDGPEKLLAAERWLRRLLAHHWGDNVYSLSAKELAEKLQAQTCSPATQEAQALLEAAQRYKFAAHVPPQAEIQRLTHGLTTCWQAWSVHPPSPATDRTEPVA